MRTGSIQRRPGVAPAAWAGLLLTGLAAPLHGQVAEPGVPPLGARVRLESQDGSHVVGTVQAIDADTIRIYRGREYDPAVPLHAVPLRAVRSYTVSMGRDRGRGARNGALIGGGLGLALVAYAGYQDAAADDAVIVPGSLVAVPVALGLTGIGALLGARLAPDRWSSPVKLGLGSRERGSLNLGFTVRY